MIRYYIEKSAGQLFLHLRSGGTHITLIADSYDEIKKYAKQLHLAGFDDEKNEHYYLRKADDAICDAIFFLHCASITAVGADADIQDRSITTLIRALRYSRETIEKIGDYTYEKDT